MRVRLAIDGVPAVVRWVLGSFRRSACLRAPSGARASALAYVRPIAAFFALVLLATPASAADDATVFSPRSAGRAEAPAESTAGSLNSMSLLLAVALAGAGGWMFWRNRRAQNVGRDQRTLSVEETRSLGNRQYLVVASYEGKKFLLGVCPGRIDMLSTLERSDAAMPVKLRE